MLEQLKQMMLICRRHGINRGMKVTPNKPRIYRNLYFFKFNRVTPNKTWKLQQGDTTSHNEVTRLGHLEFRCLYASLSVDSWFWQRILSSVIKLFISFIFKIYLICLFQSSKIDPNAVKITQGDCHMRYGWDWE